MKKTIKLADLDQETKRRLEVDNRDVGLDGGTFFDGYFFRDVMGSLLKSHPNAEEIYKMYLIEQNAKITAHNDVVKDNEKVRRKFYMMN